MASAKDEEYWANAGESLAVLHSSEKVIEEKEKQLRDCIARKYTEIHDVEKELGGLQLQLQLSTGPKKSALMLLRKKIEAQNERVLFQRELHRRARKAAEEAQEALAVEERLKERLCEELNMLVQQSAHAQLEKLEQLTRRLEALQNGPAVEGAPESATEGDGVALPGPAASAPPPFSPPAALAAEPRPAPSPEAAARMAGPASVSPEGFGKESGASQPNSMGSRTGTPPATAGQARQARSVSRTPLRKPSAAQPSTKSVRVLTSSGPFVGFDS